jgi:DNA-binding LacI/PurR family transcriptional regulator
MAEIPADGAAAPATGPWRKRSGIVDVAARAGVSQATVSRALRDHPSVTAATRAKVRAAATELGYVPSAFAAALARGRSNTIGVVAPWATRWFFATVIEGINEVVAQHRYDLLLYPIGPGTGSERRHFDAMGLDKRVDGVIGLALPTELRAAGTMRRLPIVTVGTSTPGIPGVQVDDSEVGYLATRHLIELGHRRIAFLGLDPDDVYEFKVADDRYAGHCRALTEATLTPDPGLVVTTGFLAEAGEAALEELLFRADWEPHRLPTAVVAVSDELAMGVIYAARKRGLRVPQDLSVVGVDDHELARYFDLTTVAQPVIEQGRIAAQMLWDLMHSGRIPDPEVIRLPPGLIVRDSTAPPR